MELDPPRCWKYRMIAPSFCSPIIRKKRPTRLHTPHKYNNTIEPFLNVVNPYEFEYNSLHLYLISRIMESKFQGMVSCKYALDLEYLLNPEHLIPHSFSVITENSLYSTHQVRLRSDVQRTLSINNLFYLL